MINNYVEEIPCKMELGQSQLHQPGAFKWKTLKQEKELLMQRMVIKKIPGIRNTCGNSLRRQSFGYIQFREYLYV